MKITNLNYIFYKNTFVKKHNTYTWCGIVDKNGRMLKTHFPELIEEFADHISECIQAASDMLMDEEMYQMKINKHFRKFFKLVSPKRYEEYLYPIHRERGRYMNESVYLFGNWYDAFYNVEFYFKGVLWLFTTLQHLKDYLPYIDRVRILRVNHDFVELFGKEAVEPLTLDEIISENFGKFDEIKSKQSEQLCKIANAKASKKVQVVHEVWDNGMKILKTDEEEKKLKSKELPELYDYHFEIWKKEGKEIVREDSSRKRTNVPYTPPEKRTLNRDRISLVLR